MAKEKKEENNTKSKTGRITKKEKNKGNKPAVLIIFWLVLGLYLLESVKELLVPGLVDWLRLLN
jgi:hypothetical protein